MKMKSIAPRPFKYAGRLVQPQSEFSVKSEKDAKLLAIMGRASVVAEPVTPAATAPVKRTYKRRDMTAEPAVLPPVVFEALPVLDGAPANSPTNPSAD